MRSIGDFIRLAEKSLKESGIATPRVDAELILSHVLGCKRCDIYINSDKIISKTEELSFHEILTRRIRREPLQYIIGEVEFYGIKLKVDKNVLIPRHETEELVDIVISQFSTRSPSKILDIGTGSGAIGLAFAKTFPHSQVLATDISLKSIEIARQNAKNNNIQNIRFVQSDWFSNITETFDLIVSNPPYLSEEEFQNAQEEVKFFEPKFALVAQDNGISEILKIIASAKEFLTPTGILAIETGVYQHFEIKKFSQNYFPTFRPAKDCSGRDRFVFFSFEEIY